MTIINAITTAAKLDHLHSFLRALDWERASEVLGALACVGEGKRIVAALESAGRRHADNIGITAHRVHKNGYDFGEIILFSSGGAFTSRHYEIHIPVELTEKEEDRIFTFEYAFLVTSSGDGFGCHSYPAPILSSWNALRWAIIHVGELRACAENLVEVFEVGGYMEPADRHEKTIEEYFDLGWDLVRPILEEGFNSPVLVKRVLVLEWNFGAPFPRLPEVWEACPLDCKASWEHEAFEHPPVQVPKSKGTDEDEEEEEFVSYLPDLTDPRPICFQRPGEWPRWHMMVDYPGPETWLVNQPAPKQIRRLSPNELRRQRRQITD